MTMLHRFPAVLLLCAPLLAQTPLATVYGTTPNGQLGTVLRNVGDVDGDGIADFVASEPGESNQVPGRVLLISGRTRATLVTFQGQAPAYGLGTTDVCPIGDVNGDGRPDFAIPYYGGGGVVDVFSGASGARLYRLGPTLDYRGPVCGVGDQDGDGRDDFAAVIYTNSTNELWVHRGTNGVQLFRVATNVPGGFLFNVGDLNGDGRPEVAAVEGRDCSVYDVHGQQLLRTISIQPCCGQVGQYAVADWNHDGHLDLLTQFNGIAIGQPFLFVHSLMTGGLLRSYLAPPVPGTGLSATGIAVLGDFDGDGTPDYATFQPYDPLNLDPFLYSLTMVSGRTGLRLGSWPATAQAPMTSALAALGDVDGDGYPDLVVGIGLDSRGGWQLISGRTFAVMTVKPVNCYSGPFPPQLGMTRPVLGGIVTFAGRDAPPGGACTLALSALPAVPTNLGVAGCDAWFDVGNWVILALPSQTPSWTVSLPLPSARQLIGFEVALQAFYVGTSTPLGYDLTNGMWARLGY